MAYCYHKEEGIFLEEEDSQQLHFLHSNLLLIHYGRNNHVGTRGNLSWLRANPNAGHI